ncbi:hypothetical protein [Streptomyces amritsarensis]|uniref:hypothetical protein n=1 Tax=Streptomyces amritsarensis TaxID=681158 RepID=UPI0036CF32D0
MTDTWNIVAFPPIDDFSGMTPLSDFVSPKATPQEFAEPLQVDHRLAARRDRLTWAEDALTAFRKANCDVPWDGEFRHEPYVGQLPQPGGGGWYLVVKQENNGNCFVISKDVEIPLPSWQPHYGRDTVVLS